MASNSRHFATCHLGAVAYRCNRRFDRAGLVVHPIIDLAARKPALERVIRHVEVRVKSGCRMLCSRAN